jgi:phospholipase C
MSNQRLKGGALLVMAVVFTAAASAMPGVPLRAQAAGAATKTPIQHLVVIFGENISFDHYFATYPQAMNPSGEPAFNASPSTPAVNGLSGALLTSNPNSDDPFRFSRSQSLTCDQDHNYTDEQKAYNHGLLDQFVQAAEGKPSNPVQYCPKDAAGNLDAVMGYYDGNTVSALWNYAQGFALNDNSYTTVFGPSTPGAINLVGADTSGVLCGPGPNGPTAPTYGDQPACGDKGAPPAKSTSQAAPTGTSTGTATNDSDPYWDICSKQDASALSAFGGKNIGDLLNGAGVTWGWFEGGFTLTSDGGCNTKHVDEAADRAMGVDPGSDTNSTADYIPHHEPFQYYASTANPAHLDPTSAATVGTTDQANHQYDLTWFWQAANSGNLPAVSFLKAPAYQDGHAGYSDPLDEQTFVVNTINQLMALPTWPNTAVVIAYDDSDGWYDHQMPPIVSQSSTSVDVGCGATNTMNIPARCGYGTRVPLLVISPFARANYVSHTVTDQTSILRFIEDNWLGGKRISGNSFDNVAGMLDDMFDFSQTAPRALMLDPNSGGPAATGGR